MLPTILARQHGDAINYPPTRIVTHGTVSPCRAGQARRTGDYFAAVKRPASAHLVTDPGQTVRCVPDNVVAYHAPPNLHSLGHELCDPQGGPASRWQDAPHQAMLRRAAVDDAAWAVKYGIPIRHLTIAQLRAHMRGLCGHVDISNAFGMTDHVDPGDGFPWTQYIGLVKRAAGAGATKPPSLVKKAVARVTRKLAVDGDMGPATWTALAGVLGRAGQPRNTIVTALQQRLGGLTVDGQLGLATTRSLQRRLGVPADGVWGPATTKALQRRINTGRI